MNDKCAVLVTTCDKYDDAWIPFFTLFQKNWPECDYPLYVNTERKTLPIQGLKLNWLLLSAEGPDEAVSWSKRLKEALERIDCEFILFMLEDFFIQKPVRKDKIAECIQWMEQEPEIGVIYFYPTENDGNTVNTEFSSVKRACPWAINGDCGIWRRSFLISILRDENPWEFEVYGTYRWRRTSYQLLAQKKDFDPIIQYVFDTECGKRTAIIQGKWLPCVPEFLESNDIKIDYQKRGFADLGIYVGEEREKGWLINDIKESLTSWNALKHYCDCLIKVVRHSLVPIKALLFHR